MTDADTTERTETERRRRRSPEDLEDRLVAEGEIAGDYLEELLDLLDFDGDIDLDVEGDRAIVSIDGGERSRQARRPQGRGARRAAGADPAGGAPEDRRAQPADAGHRALAPRSPRRAGRAGRQGGAPGAGVAASASSWRR